MHGVVAYIDGANLHKGAQSIGLDLDYERLYTWLGFKYHITDAYLFIGMIPDNIELYNRLTRIGYKIIFKEVIFDGSGKPKGNCDADLVLKVVSDFYEKNADEIVLVSSDGDYACVMDFLITRGRRPIILSPSRAPKCSILLKRTGARIAYLVDFKHLLRRGPKNSRNHK
jgi:uncharacterized LabA/DUF88 family protein